MKNLGKFIVFLILFQNVLTASVTAKVDYDTVELGEMVTYSLDLSGENITRPTILSLCGTDVISTSSQTSMQVINGNFKKSYILSYKFLPQKSCTIEPIDVEIDGKVQKTNSVKVSVKKVSSSKERDFSLELLSNKKSVYIGEEFELILLFKQKRNSRAVDSKFVPPELKGFWIKKESKPTQYNEANYLVTKITYTMAAQRVGKLKIKKAQMRIASRVRTRDMWSSWTQNIRWKTYFSNDLEIDVKELQNGVNLIGDFTIFSKVDKVEVNANEAVNLTVILRGDGNLEDVESFKVSIDDVSVFDEKIDISSNILTQKIAFVSDRDFKIPAMSIKYFDLKTKKIKTISTKEISIKVKNAKVKEDIVIKRDDKSLNDVKNTTTMVNGYDKVTLIIVFFVGIVIGILIMLIKPFKVNGAKKDKKVSLKEPKILLIKLLPYKDDVEVKKILDLLEESIYSNKVLDIDKKQLKEILKKYNID